MVLAMRANDDRPELLSPDRPGTLIRWSIGEIARDDTCSFLLFFSVLNAFYTRKRWYLADAGISNDLAAGPGRGMGSSFSPNQ